MGLICRNHLPRFLFYFYIFFYLPFNFVLIDFSNRYFEKIKLSSSKYPGCFARQSVCWLPVGPKLQAGNHTTNRPHSFAIGSLASTQPVTVFKATGFLSLIITWTFLRHEKFAIKTEKYQENQDSQVTVYSASTT